MEKGEVVGGGGGEVVGTGGGGGGWRRGWGRWLEKGVGYKPLACIGPSFTEEWG